MQLGRMGQYTEDQRGRGARDRDRDQARMQRRQGQTQEGNVQPQNQQGIESERYVIIILCDSGERAAYGENFNHIPT